MTMYQSAYDMVASGNADRSREIERAAFEHSIKLLEMAREKGAGSRESIDALHFVSRLWSVLLQDLAEEGNELPASLKASLISIGIWVLKRTEDIRQGHSGDFTSLIEISESLTRGLAKARNVHSSEAR